MTYVLIAVAVLLLAIAISVPPFVLFSGIFSSDKDVKDSEANPHDDVASANNKA
ncbi:hypothetical protein [Candidatus Albibeggiatoa sp. nov. NOAA]|uniref:hypothetical protein n=1 Tax=Candidatus Albibeggiatoa sp. nov. NOAA TaxID=3162724 RepID=UPI0032FA657E|nr:hypothetical protein [Thiotrichaceae bacterium]